MTYKIQLTGGKEIPLYFGTWSLSRFCEMNGDLSFTGMQELFLTDVSYKHIISLILCGAEHQAKLNNLPFNYTDLDAAGWIDDMGGLASEKSMELLKAVGQAINPSFQGVEVSGGKKPAKKK